MGTGGKKAKAKDKNSKAAAMKQKIKKSKSPEGTESRTTIESSAPSSPNLVAQDQDLDQAQGVTLEPASKVVESIELDPSEVCNKGCGTDQISSTAADQQVTVKEDHPDSGISFQGEGTPESRVESEERHSSKEGSPLVEPRQRRPSAVPFAPFSPVPALVPLPSPSLTEARFMSSPSPETHFHYPPPPAFFQYPSPYTSPYASPYVSPVPKVSSPLARSHYPYMPPAMSPTATPPPPATQPVPPTPPAPAPVASAAPPSSVHSPTLVQSPVMSTAGVVPPYAPCPPHPPDGHFTPRSYSIADPSYASSFQAIRDLGLGNGQSSDTPPENDIDHLELLQRIQAAIPDINRLLHGFRHTHSKLSSREAEMKQIGNQHEQALMHKDFYIEALQSQMKKTANESAEECAKLKNTINELRLELGNLQEKQKDLEDGLATHQKSNEELSQTKSDLEAEIAKLNTSIQEAKEAHEKEREEQKEERAKALATQKQELTELFEEIKNEDEKAATEALEARDKELRDQLDSQKGVWEKEKASMEETLEAQRKELEDAKTELASKIAALESKKTELAERVAELTSARSALAFRLNELEEKEREMAEIRNKSAQELETLEKSHSGEVEAMQRTHEEQLAAAAKGVEEKIAALEAHFAEKEHHWTEERAALEKLLSEKDSELMSAEREKEKLEGDGYIKEQQLQRAVDEMRSTIDHLDRDCERLRKTLHSLGEATDLKTTKGDQFL